MILSISNGLASEAIKQKRGGAYWFVLFAPLSMAFLYYLLFNDAGERIWEGESTWAAMFRRSYKPINSLMLPLFICVMTSLVHFIDHKNHTWKHIYALPVAKSSVFLSKSLFSLGLLIITLLVYPFLIVAAGYLASFTEPALAGLREIDLPLWESGLMASYKGFVSSLTIWTFHNWVSYRLKSFAIPIGIGLLGTITSLTMASGWAEEMKFFPYSFSLLASAPTSELLWYEQPLFLGAVGGVLLFALSLADAVRRDVD